MKTLVLRSINWASAAGLALGLSAAARGDILFSDDFETIPAPADNVPNVVLTAPAPILEWYNHYNNAGWQVGAEEGDLSVAMFPVDHNNNRWPDPSSPDKSAVLSVGWAYESVQTIITLDLDQKWDSTKDYRLSFQWALADHGSKTGRNFKAVAYGCPSYETTDFSSGAPVQVERARSYPLDGAAFPNSGALIKELDLDPDEDTPMGVVQQGSLVISGAEIAAAAQDGSQIYLGFEKGANTEFFMVDNVRFEEVIETPQETELRIVSIEYAGGAAPDPTVTLTWTKTDSESYIARFSRDMRDWGSDLDDTIGADRDENPEDGDLITVTFPLAGAAGEASQLFFRVEEGEGEAGD